MKESPNVLVIASGSIGVLQLPQYLMYLLLRKIKVKCIMTKTAANIIPPKSIAAYVDTFTDEAVYGGTVARVPHIALGEWATHVLVLPASANIIAKMAYGIADDLATTTVLSTKSPLMIFPNMGKVMAEQAVVVENVSKLKDRGYIVFDEFRTNYAVCKNIEETSLSLPPGQEFCDLMDRFLALKGGEIYGNVGN
ncbi:flavoprotein [Brevibacillus parabrevis]|uniref:flavoprotein n=1 Tax=Brevibacillus parabrevis TaxID=54914 RepID=UPI002E1B2DAA|nr:flavoprotein [Brevibacillus parabrevis]MED1721161.1 flavoprotein [Brevibacillus parabrevis]